MAPPNGILRHNGFFAAQPAGRRPPVPNNSGQRDRDRGERASRRSPADQDSHRFSRSYYRCTSQKCSVKKHVERSFEDPTTVIITYEGQHTHHIPPTTRGVPYRLAPPPAASSIFSQGLLMHPFHPLNYNGQQMEMNSNTNLQNLPTRLHQLQDYDHLQDVVPSFINNHQQ